MKTEVTNPREPMETRIKVKLQQQDFTAKHPNRHTTSERNDNRDRNVD